MADTFFQHETHLAQKALGNSVTLLVKSTADTILPARLIKDHPLASVATAAAVGLTAGLLIPVSRHPTQPSPPTPPAPSPSFFTNLEAELLHALRPTLQSVATTLPAILLTPKSPTSTTPPSDEPSTTASTCPPESSPQDVESP